MPIKVVTAPAAYPVTLSEAKEFARVSIDTDDTLITSYIVTATAHAEHITGLRFVTQTLDLYLDAFPGAYGAIELPGPVQSVTSVTYTDTDEESQTLDDSKYTLDAISNPARLVPAYDEEWPETLDTVNVVVVRFISGAATSACPEEAKTFIKACVAHLYDDRQGDPFQMYSGLLSTIRREFSV